MIDRTQDPAGDGSTGPLRWRKKPVVIEAMLYDGTNINALWDWAGAENIYGPTEINKHPLIITMEGNMEVRPGSYVIRGVQGEFYPCDPDIFEATYEAAS